MGRRALLYPLSVVLLASVSLFSSACGTLEIGIEPTASPTATSQAVDIVPTATPTPTVVPTPTLPAIVLEPAPDEVKLDVVDQVGGPSLTVAVGQGRAYLGVGPRVVVLDSAFPLTDSLSIGQSEVLPGIVQDVYLVDNLAYVAAGEAGLIVLDVRDPSNIHALSTASIRGDSRSVVVEPESGLAYVVTGDQLGPGQGGTLSIIDLSEPEVPEPVTAVEIPGFAYDVALVEQDAYVVYEGGLLVIGISDPSAPIEVANIGLPQGARDVAVIGGYAYVSGDGLRVIDVSDPAKPQQVSHLEARFPAKALSVWGELACLSETFCEMGHCGSTIHIIDVSDPARPHEVGTWSTQSTVEGAVIYEHILYLASRQHGLQAVDVGDPANPQGLGAYATLGSVEAVAVSDGYAYVSDGAQSGLQVLDLGTPKAHVRGIAESTRWADGYAIVDGYAYVPVWADGFRIVDVRGPDNPREAASVDIGMAEQAAVTGAQAYVTIGYEGLAILDVADPSNPRVLSETPLDGLAEGLAVAEDHAYVSVDDGEQNTLYAVDVSDPSQPNKVGLVALEGKGLNVALDSEVSQVYVAVADCAYYLGTPQCSGGLQVVDVRDPARPRTAAFVEVPNGVFGIAVTGGYVFVAAGQRGVWVLDVSAPENPRAVGWADTAGGARNVVVAGNLIYVADQDGGLLIQRVTW